MCLSSGIGHGNHAPLKERWSFRFMTFLTHLHLTLYPPLPSTLYLAKAGARFISLLLCLAKRLRKLLKTDRCRHYISYSVYMVLFHSHNNHLKWAVLAQFHGSENRGQEILGNSSRVTTYK